MTHLIAIQGVPYDGASSHLRGCAEAPEAIREALRSGATNMFSEDGTDTGAPGVLHDAGDITFGIDAGIRETIANSTRALLEQGMIPLTLGGDHSITYPVVQAVAARHPNLTIVQFDAHPDLYDEYEGDRYSHACPFARIMEEGLAKRLVQVGIRTANTHQREQARRFGAEVIEMRQLTDGLALSFDGPVYISLDIDVLDPSSAPGISHWEPGGMSVRQLVAAIQGLKGRVAGADIVEYNPVNDINGMTAVVCAKLLREIAAKLVATNSD